MGKLLGFGALTVGAYLLYEWWLAQQGIANPVTPTPTGNNTGNQAGANNLPQQNERADLLRLSGVSDTVIMTADQWNYYRNQLTYLTPITGGVFDAAFVTPYSGDRSKGYTVDQFLVVIRANGLAGLGRTYLSGLGIMPANLPISYTQAFGYGMNGLGLVGPGYSGYNGPGHNMYGDATKYELASKFVN